MHKKPRLREIFFATLTAGCLHAGPSVKMRIVVPAPSLAESSPVSPTGESEAVRYAAAYEAFWSNCVALRATLLYSRCPFIAAGTLGASTGASAGGIDASNQIEDLLAKYGPEKTRAYWSSLASRPELALKMRRSFARPSAEECCTDATNPCECDRNEQTEPPEREMRSGQ